MSKRLPVPPELEHLVEKREPAGRRAEQRRTEDERREFDLGPLGPLVSGVKLEDLPLEERRETTRREPSERRRKSRRRKQG